MIPTYLIPTFLIPINLIPINLIPINLLGINISLPLKLVNIISTYFPKYFSNSYGFHLNISFQS